MTRQLLIVLLLGTTVLAQAPQPPRLAFEVASVKPYEGKPVYSFTYPPDGGFRAILTLEWLIGIAYDIRPFERIVDEPRWARTEYFEVAAKPAATVSRGDTHAMLRTLIEDRFGLVWRKDPSGKAVIYALTMAREDRRLGPGVRTSDPACSKDVALFPPVAERQLRPGVPVPCGAAGTDHIFTGGGMRGGMLAVTIQLAMGGEVVDRTGLTGMFDFYLDLPRGQNPDRQDVGDVSIFTAVQEQLGMKLQREVVTRDVFIVERVSQPTPN